MSTQADKIAQRAKNEQKIEDARMAAALDPYGLEARRAAQKGKIMVTNAEGQQAFVDPNNKEVLKIYRGLGFNPGSIAANSTKDRNTAINEAINKTSTKIKADSDKKITDATNKKAKRAWSVKGQLDGTGKLQDTGYVPFNQYMQMKRMAEKYPENRAYQNIVSSIESNPNTPSVAKIDPNSPSFNADMEATYIKGNSNTVPYNNMDTLAQGNGMAGLGIYRTDASKDIYRPEGYNVPGNYRQAGTYNVGIDGTVKDNTVSNTAPEAVYTATGQTFSGDGGNASGVVKTPYVAPAPKQTFQEYQNLNKIARNPDYEVGVEEPPVSAGVPIHPVTGLPIEAGGDKWPSYTDAPEGRTYNNKNFNWNNSSPGQVPSMSQQEIDVLYGRTPSPVQPKQEVDFSGIANWFRKNWGK